MPYDIRQILELAVEHGASDVVATRGAAIAYKINGRWAQVNADPLTSEGAKTLIYSILTPDQIARLERDRELDFSFELESRARAEPAPVADGSRPSTDPRSQPAPGPAEPARRIEVRNESAPAESSRRIEMPKDPASKDSARDRITRFRFRGNAFFQRGSTGAVFRLIPREVPTIERLGLPNT
ncbi:MAG: hypothetical protein ACRELB_16835, partial [Polyangiaceae bacterium]